MMKFDSIFLVSFVVMAASLSFPTTAIPTPRISWRSLLTSEELAEYKAVFDDLTTDLLPFKFFAEVAEAFATFSSSEFKSYMESIDINDQASIEDAERFLLSKLQDISAAANMHKFNAPSEAVLAGKLINRLFLKNLYCH